MGRPTIRIPGDEGEERQADRVNVSLPCKAWENVSETDAIGHIEGHSPVRFSSPCEEEDPNPGGGR